METILNFFKKYSYLLLSITFILMYISSCRKESLVKSYNKRFETMEERLLLKQEIESLKSSKRMLQDMNYVVFTKQRPDSAIKQYDFQISNMEKKIKDLE